MMAGTMKLMADFLKGEISDVKDAFLILIVA